ncbi:MAG: ComEC/Rec2 family competence protein, partial [Thermoleophilaceae bacterium]
MTVARAVALVAVGLFAGAVVVAERLAAIDAPAERLAAGERISGRAHLLHAPRSGPFGASAEVELASGPHAGARLLARLPRGAGLPGAAGSGLELMLTGSFQPLAAGADDGGFDLGAYLRRRGVAGELDVERVRATGGRRDGAAGAIDAIRRRAETAIATGLSPTAAALARGMVLGADESIPRTVRDDFRDAGLAHLLAVSGQNVMLLVVLALPLLAATGLSHTARIPFLLALIALYVPLAGGGPSVQRAGVMGAAGLVAMAAGRPASRWYALALAACVTLTLNPRAVGDVGWQLSFAAVAGIVLLAARIRRRLTALPAPVAEGVALTVSATVATAPLVAHHFGTVPVAGLAANVAALPLVAPIMWLGMVRAALGQAIAVGGPLAGAGALPNAAVGIALGPLVDGLERLSALFADAPGGQLRLTLAGPVAVGLAYAAIALAVVAAARVVRRLDTRASTAVARVRRLPRSRRAALAVAAALVTMLVVARGLAPAGPPTELTVSFLDVGQGDATLVQHPDGSAVLFDGGPPEGGVARLLRRAGVGRLSALVMTHASRDHHGGLRDVVERYPVDLLLDGGDGTRDRGFRQIAARAVAGGA